MLYSPHTVTDRGSRIPEHDPLHLRAVERGRRVFLIVWFDLKVCPRDEVAISSVVNHIGLQGTPQGPLLRA